MEITKESYARVDFLTVAGRVDSSNFGQLEKAVKETLEAKRHNLVVNLSGVEYLSSAGLRALVSGMRECRNENGDLRISSPSSRVDEVLNLAGLNDVFLVFDSDTAAVGSF